MSEFLPAVNLVLKREGGYSDNLADGGGATNFGISFRLYKSLYPDALIDDIKNLTVAVATHIYRIEFWNNTSFNLINNQNISNSAFDAAVNMGIATAVKLLQRACNSTHENSEALLDDGILGNETLQAINNSYAALFLTAFRSERAGYYRSIVAANPSQEVFLRGWLARAYSA